jgi:hypothetical protein
MAWTYAEIESGWLRDSVIAVLHEHIVSAFDRCERVLGREWLDGVRDNLWGAPPTLHVVATGHRLRLLDGLTGSEQLIDKLRENEASAYSELHAMHLLSCGRQTDIED